MTGFFIFVAASHLTFTLIVGIITVSPILCARVSAPQEGPPDINAVTDGSPFCNPHALFASLMYQASLQS